jgi:PadR family transcriptional regulator PadR
MTRRRSNPDYLNGVPELVVLQILSRRAMYGYELVQAIREQSGGGLSFGEGCIYPLLHKLEARGELASRRVQIGNRSRVVYRATDKGRGQLAEAVARWQDTATAVTRILQGGSHEVRYIA